jgi:hypothetical protein
MKGQFKNELNQDVKFKDAKFDFFCNEFFQIQNLVTQGNDSISLNLLKDEPTA